MTRHNSICAVVALASALLAFGAVGCGSNWQNYEEEFVRAGILGPNSEKAPAWVRGEMPVAKDEKGQEKEIYFVGRGIGYNVLDERAAYDAARDHALQQLGKQIATWISVRTVEGDVRYSDPKSGLLLVNANKPRNRFLPGEQSNQWLQNAVRMCTEALAGDLEDKGVYWEQWYLEEKPERPLPNELRMKRYKCWVLMSVSKVNLESRIVETLKLLKIAAARPHTLFEVTDQHVRPEPAPRLDTRGAEKLRGM